MSSYTPVPDPFPGKGPLSGNAPDFYEREELFTTIQNILLAGDSVSMVGERKAGKTSFLKYLQTHLPDDEFILVYVDAQRVFPNTDKFFLSRLVRSAAKAIAKASGLTEAITINTPTASAEQVYESFEEDLNLLRPHLPLKADGQQKRLVWLVDEIEMLQGYENTNLFAFLRPVAQDNTHFRFVVAGYDLLYTLSTRSEWSPFFNAFRHVRLQGLNPDVATRLIDDALTKMDVTIEPDLYESILKWTGQKPFYLKWILSEIAKVLNQEQIDHDVNAEILHLAKGLFLTETDVFLILADLWRHTTPRQQTVLSLIAPQSAPYTYPEILDDLRKEELIEGGRQGSDLIEDLTRLNQLSFLYQRVGRYVFTSGCLQDWIKKNKPL